MVHDHDLIGHRHGLKLVMGDVDRGSTDALMQLAQFLTHRRAEFGVQGTQRLIHKECLGAAHDGPAQGDPLTVAAG